MPGSVQRDDIVSNFILTLHSLDRMSKVNVFDSKRYKYESMCQTLALFIEVNQIIVNLGIIISISKSRKIKHLILLCIFKQPDNGRSTNMYSIRDMLSYLIFSP